MFPCSHHTHKFMADLQLIDLSSALQRTQLRRSSYKMLSVSQAEPQLHSYLKRKNVLF